jgi:hypothetical protein
MPATAFQGVRSKGDERGAGKEVATGAKFFQRNWFAAKKRLRKTTSCDNIALFFTLLEVHIIRTRQIETF